MGARVRVLIVEDSDDDALLLLWELKRGGFEPVHARVDTRDGMVGALGREQWDLIVSDYAMPHFSGLGALTIARSAGNDIPFIVVSGAIGEDVAVEVMKAGANDYVMKRNLSRLVPAVDRELREAGVRRARLKAELELRENEARFRAIASNIPGMVYQLVRAPDGTMAFTYVSEGCLRLLGIRPQALLDNADLFFGNVHPDDRTMLDVALARSATDLLHTNWEGRILVGDQREIKWVNLRSSPRGLADGDGRDGVLFEGIMWNITMGKLAEAEITRSREQLSELSSHIQQLKEYERVRIAREIHDDIGGNLTAIKIDLLWLRNRLPHDGKPLAEKIGAVERLVDHTMETTRRISRDLRPGILDLGLVAAIEWQAQEFQERMGIPCVVSCDEEDISAPAEMSVALFRIFQETLTNITKHARASRVTVDLHVDDRFVVLDVSDDGIGIDRENLAKRGSFGIRGMLERARSLGGSVDLACTPGSGTRIEVRMPIAPEEAHIAAEPQRVLF